MKSKLVVKRFIISIVMSLFLLFSKSYAQDLVVPISIRGNSLYIMGKINGIPIRFVLDTGAEKLVLPAQYAAMANLPAGKQITITTAGGSAAPAITTTGSFSGIGLLTCLLLSPNPLAHLRRAMNHFDAAGFTSSQESNDIQVHERDALQIEDHARPGVGDLCFQFLNVLRL